MAPDSMDIDYNVDVEASVPVSKVPAPKNLPTPSFQGPEATDRVEEVDHARSQTRYWRAYPGGYPAENLGKGKTKFQKWREDHTLHGDNEWAPFQNQKEWDLVQWLIKNVGHKSIDEYLKLPIASICTHTQRGFTNLLADSRAYGFIIP
jgi:hypothetical protein